MNAMLESWMQNLPWLEGTFLGNVAWAWCGAILTVLLVWIVGRALRWGLRRAVTTGSGHDSRLSGVLLLGSAFLDATRNWFLIIIGLLAARPWLAVPEDVGRAWTIVVTVGIALQIGLWASAMLRAWLDRVVSARAADDPAQRTSLTVVQFLGLVIVWSAVLLLALDNLGVNVSALVAGFGIGGIAVALAAQNVLGDLFASLAIILDRPFEVGDFVIVGDYLGVVDKIGLKTTRVTSLGGEQIVFGNTDLLSARIRNYKRMQRRRVAFSIDVVHGTPTDRLRAIPDIAKQGVEAQQNTTFDRAHLKDILPTALRYEFVYYIGTNDYNVYKDVQQAINLHILTELEDRGIRLAHPTYTVHLDGKSGAEAEAREATEGT